MKSHEDFNYLKVLISRTRYLATGRYTCNAIKGVLLCKKAQPTHSAIFDDKNPRDNGRHPFATFRLFCFEAIPDLLLQVLHPAITIQIPIRSWL